MEHIRQFDWCYSEPERYFVKEEDLDNCVTERILRHQFRDPMATSDSDDEKPTFDWDAIFSDANKSDKRHRVFVPGFRGIPPYPKVSALTLQQHYQCLKVLCTQNAHILQGEFIPRPTKQDHKVFEDIQTTYIKEQKEYIEWAKSLWMTGHCIRALRPKPPVETTYEAEFELKAKEMQSFPKNYTMAAQIPLETKDGRFEMTFNKKLLEADISSLPEIQSPEPITKRFSIMASCSVPEPCTKHPCRFILPNESTTTILPLTEVHRELAQFALDNGSEFVADEKALKCLVEVDRSWVICLSVCEAFTLDGERRNVLVLGSELMVRKECVQTRTYRAFRHLLQRALVPDSEKSKLRYKTKRKTDSKKIPNHFVQQKDEDSSDEDDQSLFIVAEKQTDSNSDTEHMTPEELESKARARLKKDPAKNKKADDFYKCSCEDTLFEHPPPRSFNKWSLKKLGSTETFDLIVHCSHKLQANNAEVLLEPIPEYQLDLGGSQLSKDKIKSIALSLSLRKNASVMTVRIDGSSGEVIRSDCMNLDQLELEYGDQMTEVAHTISAALSQLQHLMPGRYLLKHEVSHGRNALLYASGSSGEELMTLDFQSAPMAELDEAASLKTAPTLSPVLLPVHKFRKILPCAFTPHENQLCKEARRPPTKQRAPPSAIAWPKKSKGKKGKKKQ